LKNRYDPHSLWLFPPPGWFSLCIIRKSDLFIRHSLPIYQEDTMPKRKSSTPSMEMNPFVNAMGWKQLREALKSRESLKGGNRTPALAAAWSDFDCKSAEEIPSLGYARQVIIAESMDQIPSSDLSGHSEWETTLSDIHCSVTDLCFCTIEDLLPVNHPIETDSNYDLELGLLESVQQISLEIANTPDATKQSCEDQTRSSIQEQI
jgi:hypothetical protein